jgi:hypothetical protein
MTRTFHDQALEDTPVAFLAVTTIAVGLRIWTRTLHPQRIKSFW